MFNPNQTKSVFWLLVILIAVLACAAGSVWYSNRKKKTSKDLLYSTPLTESPDETPEETED